MVEEQNSGVSGWRGPGLPSLTALGLFQEASSKVQWSKRILNKTQRQMCKRLAGPFIPFPGLVLDVITRGQSTTVFLCIGPFLAWWQPNEQTNNQVILVQACSWLVWEGSLLQNLDEFWRSRRKKVSYYYYSEFFKYEIQRFILWFLSSHLLQFSFTSCTLLSRVALNFILLIEHLLRFIWTTCISFNHLGEWTLMYPQ